MEILYQSTYFLISFDAQNHFLHYIFNENTSQMTNEEYIKELKIFISLVQQYQPQKNLGNMLSFFFIIIPEIQEWINENLFPLYQTVGLKKLAILLSKEFIAALSIEQTMHDNDIKTFKTLFFDNEREAKIWLSVV